MNDPGQWHLYAYCANNPINYVDPSGHWKRPVSVKYRYITRSALDLIMDSIITVVCGGITLPAKKMLKEAFEKDIRKMNKKTKTKIKTELQKSINKIKYKLGSKGTNILNKLKSKAKGLKNSKLRNGALKLVNNTRVKSLFNSTAMGLVTGKVTGLIGQMIDCNTLDCVTSIGGFASGVIEYHVDGYLKDAKIHF